MAADPAPEVDTKFSPVALARAFGLEAGIDEAAHVGEFLVAERALAALRLFPRSLPTLLLRRLRITTGSMP
jgi:hypothetical protein